MLRKAYAKQYLFKISAVVYSETVGKVEGRHSFYLFLLGWNAFSTMQKIELRYKRCARDRGLCAKWQPILKTNASQASSLWVPTPPNVALPEEKLALNHLKQLTTKHICLFSPCPCTRERQHKIEISCHTQKLPIYISDKTHKHDSLQNVGQDTAQ